MSDSLGKLLLQFYDREGVMDEVADDAKHDTLLSPRQVDGLAEAFVRSCQAGVVLDDDHEEAFYSLVRHTEQMFSGYGLMILVMRGDVVPMQAEPGGEWTFVTTEEAQRILSGEDA